MINDMKLTILSMIYLSLMMVNCQLILYETNEIIDENHYQFDCLYYRVSNEELAYQELSNIIHDIIPYCFRPLNKRQEFFRTNDQQLTFAELHMNNITAKDLLLWSSPIDLVENYQFYRDQQEFFLVNKEFFYNCTKPWFGLQCQYTFEFTELMSINDIISNQFHRKMSHSSDLSNLFNNEFPCYIHLKCDDGGSSLCLDWREICDGHIDCRDEGLDEFYCFHMEMNECEQDEYRCHNGLCIPEQFWDNGIGHADCLDRSDEYADVSYPNHCYQDPTFQCEEHSCRTNWHPFACGDGQCVQTFDQCHNGRHLLLIQSISIQQNLSEQCFLAMICLTKLTKEMHGYSCEVILRNLMELLEDCPRIFQFPVNPIHFGHIRFLYENISRKTNTSLFIIPDYICYDQQLCDCIIPNFIYKNFTCLNSYQLDLVSSVTGNKWIDMILSIDSYFRSCLTSKQVFNHNIKYENSSSSLYQCRNSSKLISKHRLMDENIDCCLADDEQHSYCSMTTKHRIQCLGNDQCLSALHTEDDCPLNEKNFEKKIFFQNMCNGLGEILFQDSTNGQIYTDESQCHHWPCKNIYTQCDGYWTCPHGEDEENCTKTICPQGTLSCLSSMNYSLICLSSRQVNDDIHDCLGSMDEMEFCRRVYPSDIHPKRFRCQNSDICLSFIELCNQISSCPHNDDELFCKHQSIQCKQNSSSSNHILCHWNELEQNQLKHFAIHTSSNYPVQLQINQTISWISHEHFPINDHHYTLKNSSSLSAWYCNRGLSVRMRVTNESRCMCPPSYYGDQCQYQNERVSLTLGFVRWKRRDVYIIIVMLIKNNQLKSIDSVVQLEYIPSQSCGMKYNLYLLYSNRPKNTSEHYYYIQIDLYEKQTMTFRGSWYLSIPFLFLPVNRISALVFIPSEQSLIFTECSIQCYHGQCMKYLNRKYDSFCRCFPGWSGDQCTTPINCQQCSSDSICIGSSHNRSICICPLMKYGPRCLLTSSCPQNACQHHGQCIPTDIITGISNKQYSCICSERYYGVRCEYVKAQLNIYLEHLPIPSYLLAFFFTISNQSEPSLTLMIDKLTLFQRMVTFRISIPYHLVVIQSNDKFYLAVLQSFVNLDLITTIHPSRECPSIDRLVNSTLLQMNQFQRMKYYHYLCRMNNDLHCFLDEFYLCLCTNEHHANCFQFHFNQTYLQCPSTFRCFNGGQCRQDHPTCPSTIVCICEDCFYGNQCQFYSKSLGLTLDEILIYEIQEKISLSRQSLAIQLSALMTMMIFGSGLINSLFSIFIFRSKTSQEVGCGIYLFISSIFSLGIVILFTVKFWLMIYSSMDFFERKIIRFINCMIIESLLKLFVNINNWLNACVAGERALTVFKGVLFDKKTSQQTAKWLISCVIIINLLLLLPQIIHLDLFEDPKDQRIWCVIRYSEWLNNYQSFILFFHFFAPFLINFLSALFIIIGTAYQRVRSENEQQQQFVNHFQTKFQQHKHLLISPIILLILSLPRLIISFTLTCQRSSNHFWFYLSAYFISFLPSIFIFMIFVLPSPMYKKEFRQLLSRIQRRYGLFINRR